MNEEIIDLFDLDKESLVILINKLEKKLVDQRHFYLKEIDKLKKEIKDSATNE